MAGRAAGGSSGHRTIRQVPSKLELLRGGTRDTRYNLTNTEIAGLSDQERQLDVRQDRGMREGRGQQEGVVGLKL